LKRGVVEHFDSKKCFGFIKSDLGMKHNIYFHLSKVVNTQGTDVIIQKGSKIRYEVQPDSKDKPRASIVYLDFQSVSQTSGMKGSGGSWLKGEIVDKKECFCFIRPLEPLPRAYPDDKDVYLSLKFISSHSLGLNVGDLVEFRLGARKPEKPEASSFKVLKYKSRDSDELTSFMEEKSKIIKEKPNIAGELLSERGLWLTLSEQANILPEQNSSNRIFPHFVKFFLDFLVTVLGNASVHKQAAKELVKALSETSFFKPEGGLLKLVEKGLGDTNTICEALFNMVTVYPEYNATCSTILEAQDNKDPEWLIKFYKLALCHNRELNMSTAGKNAFILKNAFIFWSCLTLLGSRSGSG
jgi:cold shock CspA family protein